MRRTKRDTGICRLKVAYPTWEEASSEGFRIWRTRDQRPNPATPYPCEICGQYHLCQSPVRRRQR